MTDAVVLAQRLAALLDAGRRVATYKLALLLALLDACAEAETPPAAGESFGLSILDLADRVIELYWPQVRTYPGHNRVLRQSTGSRAIILSEVELLRPLGPTLAAVRLRSPQDYERARRKVGLTLAKQPLPALQTPGGRATARSPFLYDDTWLSYDITVGALEQREWRLELLPGVADGLVRLSGLLRPAIERSWTDDVARLNHLDREYEDLPKFLFGAERSGLARAAAALRDLEGPTCFYCRRSIRGQAHVDHFVPWARVPFNGLANLVLTDAACNLDKSDSLAAPRHLDRWHDRDLAGLEHVGLSIDWPAEVARSQRIVRGLYVRLPTGTPLWESAGNYVLSA